MNNDDDVIWTKQTALPPPHPRLCSLDSLWNAPLQLADQNEHRNEDNLNQNNSDDHDDDNASMGSFWFDDKNEEQEQRQPLLMATATAADGNVSTSCASITKALVPLPLPASCHDKVAPIAAFPESNNHKACLVSSLHHLSCLPAPTPLSCPSSASLVLPSSSSSSFISADCNSNSSSSSSSSCCYPSHHHPQHKKNNNKNNMCGDPSHVELLQAKHRTMQQLLDPSNNSIRLVEPVSTYGCKPSSFLRAALHKVDTMSDLDLDGSQNSNCSSYLSRLLRPQKKRRKDNDDDDDDDAAKRPLGAPPSTPLHTAVVRTNVTAKEIDLLLRQNAKFASVSAVLPPIQTMVMDPLTRTLQPKVLPQPYTYPLHLAIFYKASVDILQMLISAAPSVLLLRDGPNQETPLLLLLKKHQTLSYLSSVDLIQLIDAMLLKNPKCALLPDRHLNTALHTACAYGIASVDIVRHLFIVHPHALWKRNQNGQTPLQLAQRQTVTTPEDVAVFLWDKQSRFGNKEYYV